ncbi:MAG TPA: hypothetical protein VJX94_00620 [Stellaceae bacterium]|nr:hypothetical protein [Stellaceae bacterium]
MSDKSKPSELDRATRLVRRICRIAGDRRLIDRLIRDLARHGVRAAIRRRDTPVLFDWLLEEVSYQGIGDYVAHGYMERHGRVRWSEIAALIEARPSCPKLQSYWHFDRCGYQKVERCCAEPDHFSGCPLPTHDLRNGRLNQAAYSLFLFMRDVANGDFVGWIDQRLGDADLASAPDRAARLRQAVVEPLAHAYGVSNKVVSMALAGFLLAGDAQRVLWIEAGVVMIAVDTLVHNFLHRTGILRRLGKDHAYGTACYAPAGCSEILERIAGNIDARRFNPAFPANFPRFVQHAVWAFCAEGGLDECNGRQIDDRKRCTRSECPVFRLCDRVPLKPKRDLQDD